MINLITESLNQFIDLLFPRLCVVCKKKLIQKENHICLECMLHMPRTNHHKQQDNPMEQLFYGRVRIERACSLLEFKKGSDYQLILHELKYRGQKELGEFLGEHLGAILKIDDIITSADLLCPVPLHPKKERQRGYNQSYHIAVGLSRSLKIPVNRDNLYRNIHTSTQTRKSRWDRWQNVEGIFDLKNPEVFENKHIILVDDVVTTGATLEACASVILNQTNCKLSIVTLAIA